MVLKNLVGFLLLGLVVVLNRVVLVFFIVL